MNDSQNVIVWYQGYQYRPEITLGTWSQSMIVPSSYTHLGYLEHRLKENHKEMPELAKDYKYLNQLRAIWSSMFYPKIPKQ